MSSRAARDGWPSFSKARIRILTRGNNIKTARKAQITATLKTSAGSRSFPAGFALSDAVAAWPLMPISGCFGWYPSLQDLLDPEIHHALAVLAGPRAVDREDLRPLHDGSQTRFDLHVRVRRREIDLVLGEEVLHGRAR